MSLQNQCSSGSGQEVALLKSRLRVQVAGDEIIVTRPGSFYSVTYYRIPDSPGLLAKSLPHQDDLRISMTAAEFLADAWKLAKQKTQVLGWS